MQKFDLPRQVLSVSTRQIIENAHSVSLPQQRVDEVRAHEASTAGHEKAGHPRSLSCCKRPWRRWKHGFTLSIRRDTDLSSGLPLTRHHREFGRLIATGSALLYPSPPLGIAPFQPVEKRNLG